MTPTQTSCTIKFGKTLQIKHTFAFFDSFKMGVMTDTGSTVDGRNPAPPGVLMSELPINWLAGFQPSTVRPEPGTLQTAHSVKMEVANFGLKSFSHLVSKAWSLVLIQYLPVTLNNPF